MTYDERKNREDIIRGTIERDPHTGLRSTEIDKAVKIGMAISDANPRMNWGQIKDAAVAATKEVHQ